MNSLKKKLCYFSSSSFGIARTALADSASVQSPSGCVYSPSRILKTQVRIRPGTCRAIIWEGNEPGTNRTLTYRELHAQVCKFANVLRKRGIGNGDRVTIYMPMIPETAYAMLACTRIGAV